MRQPVNSFGLGLVAMLLLAGCTTVPLSAPDGVVYKHDKDLQNVWLADGFDFNGYDTLLIAPTQVQLSRPLEDTNAVAQLEWAKGYLPEQFAAAIEKKSLFKSVVTNEADIKPGARVLKLDDTIIEFARGNGAARFWAGEFGAGQPVVRVLGKMTDAGRQVFVFESYRSGDSAAARLDPGWTEERKLQTTDILDLAIDLSDFMDQTSKHQPR